MRGTGEAETRLNVAHPRRTGSIATARHAVSEAVRDLVDTDALTDVTLAVGELLDNAVRHGTGATMRVLVTTTVDTVSVTVVNRKGTRRLPPVEEWRIAGPEVPHGRGLGIVRAVAPMLSAALTDTSTSVTVSWPR